MQRQAAKDLLRNYFIATWPAASSSVPFAFENEPFDQVATYVRVSFPSMPAGPQSFGAVGNRRFERNGTIAVKINIPAGIGEDPVDLLEKVVQDVFEGKSFGVSGSDDGVRTYAMSPREVGSDGQYYTKLCTIPFRFWEVK